LPFQPAGPRTQWILVHEFRRLSAIGWIASRS
jgi:hypothetical protein